MLIIAYADFPETQELQGQVIPLDTALFHYPFRIRRQGDKAVVYVNHYIYGISVNEEKGIILATNVNKDEPIIEYKLK